ncbi:hypothetical protein P3X46_025619 [Hevea brasiliensis]|uniref:Uncharacterized protein n=1 Tax=Hevea brasiliensis TaxID=3981 RepID=A0ABQ9L6B2_HEVBR|nr:putative disease resistance protein At1g50180 [Hevea brasiliensis]KAJ9160197.1 hypothetical protein P3X46_025619 [Hevea brasiliensis]
MAEAVVSVAVQKISDLLIQESVFLHGVRDEVQRLQSELKRMQCFLKDADRNQDQDDRVRNWVAEVRDLTYDAEDVIDTFLLKVARRRGEGVRGFINRASFKFTKPFLLHETGTQIKSIQAKIKDISKSMQTYGVKLDEGEASNRQQESRRSYPNAKEEYVISLDAVISDLKARLMTEEERMRVVSIVGMGGLGKTTLAKKVYNDAHVKQHFDCYSWVFVSQQFSIKDVLVGILINVASGEDKSKLMERMKDEQPLKSMLEKMKEEVQFKSVLESLKEERLIEALHSVLEEKRYLVVFDDIWTNEAWDCLKPAFLKGKKGSKVLFTTRNRTLASHADPWTSPVEPPFLTDDEGWELLERKTFPREIPKEYGCTPELEKLGREMVKKCRGLPLAVVVLGGLLATKKSLKEWEVVHGSINAQFVKWEQHHQYGGVYGILALSYHDLPFHLKPCFLYLSQFPEDWEFEKNELIRMWIAEGFILQSSIGGEETMEDVGEEYLEELVSRCVVQMSQRDHTGIGVKRCRIHDLVRDMCISKARDENFLGVMQHTEDAVTNSSSSTLQLTSSNKWRRIAIHPRISGNDASKSKFYMPLLKSGDSHLRSLFYFSEDGTWRFYMTRQQGRFIFENFRLLRVLKIDYIPQSRLPTEIGHLIHLRYIGLYGAGMNDRAKCWRSESSPLPSSIGNLRSLYTLDLRNNYVFILPAALSKLECLRHLLVGARNFQQVRLDKLRHLETLKCVDAEDLIKTDAVQKLTNLRNLSVNFRAEEEVEVVLRSPIFKLGRLRSLRMLMKLGSFLNLKPLSSLRHLTRVKLCGAIPEDRYSLHHNLEHLPASLAKLTLKYSELKRDPMSILEKLPNLRILELDIGSYEGSKIVCSAHGFPQLETLTLASLKTLEEWEIDEGAMPCLKTLRLMYLLKLKMIPEGMKSVTTIQELKICGMREGFEERVKVIDGVEGEDFEKVRHIPSILFDQRGSWKNKNYKGIRFLFFC